MWQEGDDAALDPARNTYLYNSKLADFNRADKYVLTNKYVALYGITSKIAPVDLTSCSGARDVGGARAPISRRGTESPAGSTTTRRTRSARHTPATPRRQGERRCGLRRQHGGARSLLGHPGPQPGQMPTTRSISAKPHMKGGSTRKTRGTRPQSRRSTSWSSRPIPRRSAPTALDAVVEQGREQRRRPATFPRR